MLRRDRATVALLVGDIGRRVPVCAGEVEAKRVGERLRNPCDRQCYMSCKAVVRADGAKMVQRPWLIAVAIEHSAARSNTMSIDNG